MASAKFVAIAGLFLAGSAHAASTTTSTPVPNVGEWGQCGGVNWTGGTVCPVGWICQDTGSPYFKQCLKGPTTIAAASSTSVIVVITSKTSAPTTSVSKTSTSTKSMSKTSTSVASTSTTVKSTTSVSKTSTLTITSSVKTTPTTTSLGTTTSSPVPNVGEWGQCGGQTWTGGTICPIGWICTDTGSPYFRQCLPGPTITFPTVTSAAPAPTQTFNYLITFGDSYSQTGFDITGTKPSLSNQFGNPPYPGWTTSGGANWIGRIINQNPGTLSYNFASGGATTDANLVAPFASTVLSLVDQVAEFTSNLSPPPSYAPWTSENTLFAIWIGVNDVGNAWYNSSWPTLSQQIVDRYFEQAEILYNAGGRYFAFLNVPPIQRTPLELAASTADQDSIAAAVAHYNDLLQAGFNTFFEAHPGAFNSQTQVVDTQGTFNGYLDNFEYYGVPNASCFNSDGVSCLWWNNYHPGIAIQQSIGDQVADSVGGLKLE